MRGVVDRVHRDEGGAILVLMLVGVVILLLLSWTLYDSIQVVDDKAEVQAAADMAALSQASVKARSMNMMAYANVAKRSVVAIHSTYIASFLAYGQIATVLNWVGGFIESRFDGPLGEFGAGLRNTGALALDRWRAEVRGDFEKFSGLDGDVVASSTQNWAKVREAGTTVSVIGAVVEQICGGSLTNCSSSRGRDLPIGDLVTSILEDVARDKIVVAENLYEEPVEPEDWGNLTTHYYAQDVKALENYQRYVAGVTPWWAWLEQLSRGMRNGATVTSSSPMPLGMPNLSERFVESIRDSFGSSVGMLETTAMRDTLPVRPGLGPGTRSRGTTLHPRHPDEAIMGRKIESSLRDGAVRRLMRDAAASLGGGSGPGLEASAVRHPFAVEHLVNVLASTLYSDWVAWNGGRGGPFQVGFGVSLFGAVARKERRRAPLVSQRIFDEELGPFVVNPWLLNRYRTRASWRAHSSNIVFSYLGRREATTSDRKFEPGGSKQFRRPWISREHWKAIYEVGGTWGLARSEISFQGNGRTDPDLWHPNWVARLRPVARSRREFRRTPMSLARAYHDAMPGFLLTSLIGASSGFDLERAAGDIAQMERAVRGMGPSTVDGVVR